MNSIEPKATGFVLRLLSNPTLQGLTALQKEEQILQFLVKNSRQLYPTLSSQSFFPGKNWEQIWNLLVDALYQEIDKSLLPTLQTVINDTIDLTFIPLLRQQNWPQEKIKEELYAFLKNLLQKPEARRAYTGPLSSLIYNFGRKYIEQVFLRKEYVHFELIKVQRLKMGKDEVANMIGLSQLLSPSVHLLSVATTSGKQDNQGSTVQSQFADKVFQAVKANLGVIPDQVLRSAVNSNVSFTENRQIEATARIGMLYSARCRGYNPAQKIDRGADTADKSWFSIARRNFKFYGYDVKMLDEFYKIAAENGW